MSDREVSQGTAIFVSVHSGFLPITVIQGFLSFLKDSILENPAPSISSQILSGVYRFIPSMMFAYFTEACEPAKWAASFQYRESLDDAKLLPLVIDGELLITSQEVYCDQSDYEYYTVIDDGIVRRRDVQ